MLTDEQLGERLRTRLNAEVADIVSPTGLSAVVRRRFSHQTRARRAAMLTPVAVAAAVIVAFAVPSGDSRSGGVPRADPSRPATAAPVRDIAYVRAHTLTALEAAAQYVIRVHSTDSDGRVSDRLFDQADGRYRTDYFDSQGRRDSSTALSRPPTTCVITNVSVFYLRRTWSMTQFDPGPRKPGSTPCDYHAGPYPDAAEVRAALESGHLYVIGEEQVDGKDTIHLGTGLPHGLTDIWVDASTYLPFRDVISKPPSRVVNEYSFLPRTPENLALLDLEIPDGFTYVDPRKPVPGASPVG